MFKQEFLNKIHKERLGYLDSIKDFYGDETHQFPFENFSTENAVVWIDPLDGTSDFVRGNLSAVTVLIGLSINGVSKVGIVHNPFSEENPDYGKTTVGTLEHGCFVLDYDEKLSKVD